MRVRRSCCLESHAAAQHTTHNIHVASCNATVTGVELHAVLLSPKLLAARNRSLHTARRGPANGASTGRCGDYNTSPCNATWMGNLDCTRRRQPCVRQLPERFEMPQGLNDDIDEADVLALFVRESCTDKQPPSARVGCKCNCAVCFGRWRPSHLCDSHRRRAAAVACCSLARC